MQKQIFSLDQDWKFQRHADLKLDLGANEFDMFSGYTKTGAAPGPAGECYCDSSWPTVQLPHDWLVAEEFTRDGCQGYKPRGAAWYRKSFPVPAEWEGRRLFLRFDGIACQSAVYLNSMRIARSESTYTQIVAEITELVRYGQPNQLAVRTENFSGEGWWYDGCGIYRHVWLEVADQSLFADHGVFLSAKPAAGQDWTLSLRAEVENPKPGQTVTMTVLDQEYRWPASERTEGAVTVTAPPLWSMEKPQLVPVTVSLRDAAGDVLETQTIPFGFRTVSFDVERGCCVNGKPTKLKGVCLHHDHAVVGTAMTLEIQRMRMQKLKDMGCNAVRTSHNPQSPEFYQVCDELGFAVMNEVRHFGAAEEELRQLRTMVRRDRNHPCVFFWSLFNEEPLQCSKPGEKIARRMKQEIDRHDGTRPISGGMNGPLERDGAVHVVDIMGFNYLQYGYDDFHALHPEMPIVGSENSSHLSQRDTAEAVYNEKELRRTSFGRDKILEVGPSGNFYPWARSVGETWRQIAARPFVAGGFLWTGIDYRGEAIWPSVLSDHGCVDLCCFPKDDFYWMRALWREEPILHVTRYADGPQERLFLYSNAPKLQVRAGELRAEVENDPFDSPNLTIPAGAEAVITACFPDGEQTVVSHPEGAPAALSLSAVTQAVQGKPMLLDLVLTDERGQICKAAMDSIRVTVEGGTVLGVANGDSCCHVPELGSEGALFHGMAQIAVRPQASELTVRAQAGAWTAACQISVQPEQIPAVPACQTRIRLFPWRMSDLVSQRPEARLLHDQKFNWIPTMVGTERSDMLSFRQGWATVCGMFPAPGVPVRLHLDQMQGTFELWLEGRMLDQFSCETARDLVVDLPDGLSGMCSLTLLFRCAGSVVRLGEIYLTACSGV